MNDSLIRAIGQIIPADGWYAVFTDAIGLQTRKKLLAWALYEKDSGEASLLVGMIITGNGRTIGFADQYETFAFYQHEHDP